MSRDDVTDQQLKDFLAAKDFTDAQAKELQMIYGMLSGSLQGFINAISQMLDQREELELKTKKNNEALIDDLILDLILDALNKAYIKAIQDTRTMIDDYCKAAHDLLDKVTAKQAALHEAYQGGEEDLRAHYIKHGANPEYIEKLSHEELKEKAKRDIEALDGYAARALGHAEKGSRYSAGVGWIKGNYDPNDPNNVRNSTENLVVLQNGVTQEEADLKAIHDKVNDLEKQKEITVDTKNEIEKDTNLTNQASMDEAAGELNTTAERNNLGFNTSS